METIKNFDDYIQFIVEDERVKGEDNTDNIYFYTDDYKVEYVNVTDSTLSNNYRALDGNFIGAMITICAIWIFVVKIVARGLQRC